MLPDPVDDDAERLVEPQPRVAQLDLAQQLHDLLDGPRQERHERVLVKVPRVAPREAARRREPDRRVGRRVARQEMDEELVDERARRRGEVLADPVAEEPGDAAPDEAVPARERVWEGQLWLNSGEERARAGRTPSPRLRTRARARSRANP